MLDVNRLRVIDAVARQAGWTETAQLVAEELRRHLPDPDVLTAEQRLGSPDGYRGHTLYVEPDGSFSIVALVWRPGQVTRIHDHVTWCVFGVIQGVEQEELFDADLNPMLGVSLGVELGVDVGVLDGVNVGVGVPMFSSLGSGNFSTGRPSSDGFMKSTQVSAG